MARAITKILARFFKKQANQGAIINKARLFNSYLSIFEFTIIIYYNTVPINTNQAS